MNRFVLRRCALSLLLGLFAPWVAAQEYVVGVEQTEYYPVYSYRNGDYVGYSRELLDAFAAKHGYTFKYVALPIRRLFADFLTKDTLDFKYPDNPIWQGDMKKGLTIAYSKPAFESVEGAMVIAERVGRPLSELKTLGTIRGFTPWPYLDAIKAGTIALEESDDLPGLVQKALLQRLDGIFINQAIADYHVTHELKKPGALVLDKGLPNNDVQYLLSTRKHPDVIKQFDAFLAGETALIASLRKKYNLD